MCIPKYWCHDLTSRWDCLRLLWSWFSPFSPLFWLFFVSGVKWLAHISSMVMNRRKKSALLLWNIAKHSIETSSRRCFCSIVSKRGTHLVHSFLMFKFSVNMRCIALFEMPTISASPRTFSRRSSNTILWIFFTFSVVVTSFSQPLRCSSWQLVRPLFKLRHPILYCCKRMSRLPQSRIKLGFDLGWTEIFQIKVLYHIMMTNFSHVYKFTKGVHYW